MPTELTDAEVERIDLLHEATDAYLARILNIEGGYAEGEYDLDMIDRVLETVWDCIKDRGWMTEMEFYPYREP